MIVLMPILSESENNEEFLDKALKGAKETIILIVVDADSNEEFGFAASHIQTARGIMEEIKATLGKKRKRSEEILEWGDTQSKILNIALLRKVDKVVLKEQDNEYFKELVKKIKKEKISVEVI